MATVRESGTPGLFVSDGLIVAQFSLFGGLLVSVLAGAVAIAFRSVGFLGKLPR